MDTTIMDTTQAAAAIQVTTILPQATTMLEVTTMATMVMATGTMATGIITADHAEPTAP